LIIPLIIIQVTHVLAHQEKLTENIGVWGQSLGGAIALQVMGSDNRIQFGIIESTFTDFKTITKDYFKYHLGFSFEPLSNYLIYRAGKIAKFNPADASPIKYCENIHQPILIVHGNDDKRINIRYAKANFVKIPSLKKEFLEIKNAGHLNVWQIGGEGYFKKVERFIEKNTQEIRD
jgi:esterase/lipase